MNFEEKRKISQENALKRSAASFFDKNIADLTTQEISIMWVELVIFNLKKVVSYIDAFSPNNYNSKSNEIYKDAVQGVLVNLNSILPVAPFQHADLPNLMIFAAKADNKCGVGFGWNFEAIYDSQINKDSDLLEEIRLLKKVLKELKTSKSSLKNEGLEWCTDYKYSTKTINSVWTVKES